MTESDSISKSYNSLSSIIQDLTDLGVKSGDTLLVHSSLSSMGWVCGGSRTVIEALLECVGENGNLTMPCHTAGNTDPSHWSNPPVPKIWWADIRKDMPAFDPDKSPSLRMGVIAENFRSWPNVKRSKHPIGSFCSLGNNSDVITKSHVLEPMFGDSSPLGELYKMRAKILLLGVDHDSNTSIHLAEYRARFKKSYHEEGCALNNSGKRVWKTFKMMQLETDDFIQLGRAFGKSNTISNGKIGSAESSLMNMRDLVDFATNWMSENRENLST